MPSDLTCDHTTDDRRCGLGLHVIRLVPMICASCDRYEGPSRGLGDHVAGVLSSLRLDRPFKGRRCGCGRRRAALNRVFPRNPD